MIIVYSASRVPADLRPEGARYLNPGFFTGCEPGASLVYVNGRFPKVEAAYARAGVPVADLRSRTAPVAALGAPQGNVGDHNVATKSYLDQLMAATSPRNPADVIAEYLDSAGVDYDRETLTSMREYCKQEATDTLPALADLPEAEQAEVEAVLNDDVPFVDADDAELMRLMEGTGLRSVTEPDPS